MKVCAARWGILTLLLVMTACGGDAGGDGPAGSDDEVLFRARLITPAGAEGAALFEIVEGAGVTVRPEQGRIFWRRAGDRLAVAVVRASPGSIAFLLETDDGLRPPRPRLLQVSDGDGALRPDLQAYHVDLEAVR